MPKYRFVAGRGQVPFPDDWSDQDIIDAVRNDRIPNPNNFMRPPPSAPGAGDRKVADSQTQPTQVERVLATVPSGIVNNPLVSGVYDALKPAQPVRRPEGELMARDAPGEPDNRLASVPSGLVNNAVVNGIREAAAGQSDRALGVFQLGTNVFPDFTGVPRWGNQVVLDQNDKYERSRGADAYKPDPVRVGNRKVDAATILTMPFREELPLPQVIKERTWEAFNKLTEPITKPTEHFWHDKLDDVVRSLDPAEMAKEYEEKFRQIFPQNGVENAVGDPPVTAAPTIAIPIGTTNAERNLDQMTRQAAASEIRRAAQRPISGLPVGVVTPQPSSGMGSAGGSKSDIGPGGGGIDDYIGLSPFRFSGEDNDASYGDDIQIPDDPEARLLYSTRLRSYRVPQEN